MKKIKKFIGTTILAGCILLLSAGIGMASYVTSDSFSSAGENMTFEYWDATWGTLNSVSITFDMDITSDQFGLTNNTGSTASGTATFKVSADLTGGPPSLIDSGFSYFIGSGADQLLDSDDFVYNLANGESVNFGGQHYIDTTTGTPVTGNYVGVGTFDWNVAVSQGITFAGDAVTTLIDPASDYSGSVTITYEYTGDGPPAAPVPEPTAMLLLGLGLVGLLGVGKKKLGK